MDRRNGKTRRDQNPIGSIEGHIPFKWELSDIHIRLNETDTLDIDKAKMRISFFPLLYKRLSISYLDIHRAAYCFEKRSRRKHVHPFPLPLSARLKSFSIDKLHITNLTEELSNTFAVEGSGYAVKDYSEASLKLRVRTENTSASLFLDLEEALTINCAIDGELAELAKPFLALGFESTLDVQATLKGPRAPNAPLKGEIFGFINRLEVPHLRAVDQKWKIASSFTIAENRSVHISDLFLESPLLSCKASGKISAQQELEKGTFFLNIPKLSRFTEDVGIPLKGSLQVHADYSPTDARWDLVTQDVMIGDFSYPNATGTLTAKKMEGQWEGALSLNAKNEELPLKATSTFTAVMPRELRIENLQISSQEASLTGQLSINTEFPGLEGTLVVRIPNLNHFHSAYKGSLGGVVTSRIKTICS